MPMVSIIMPNHNSEIFIKQSIESIIKQTFSDWELLIIDDCSTDKSYDIAMEYQTVDQRVHVYKNEKNEGAAFSRNVALQVATGEYIAFLDSDDIWNLDKLRKQIDFMKTKKCDFCYTKYMLIDENNLSLRKSVRIPDKLSYTKYLLHCFTGCLTVMYRRDIYPEARSFLIKSNNDYGLFLQIMKRAKNAMGMQEILACYRIHKNGISRNKLKKIKPYFELMHNNLHYPYVICFFLLFSNILIGKVWKYEKL